MTHGPTVSRDLARDALPAFISRVDFPATASASARLRPLIGRLVTGDSPIVDSDGPFRFDRFRAPAGRGQSSTRAQP